MSLEKNEIPLLLNNSFILLKIKNYIRKIHLKEIQ